MTFVSSRSRHRRAKRRFTGVNIGHGQAARLNQTTCAIDTQVFGDRSRAWATNHGVIIDTRNRKGHDLRGAVETFNRKGIGLDNARTQILHIGVCYAVRVGAVFSQHQLTFIASSGSHCGLKLGLTRIRVGDGNYSGFSQTAQNRIEVFNHCGWAWVADHGTLVDAVYRKGHVFGSAINTLDGKRIDFCFGLTQIQYRGVGNAIHI